MSPSKEDEELYQPCGLNLFCPRVQKKKKPSSVLGKKHSIKRTEIYEDDPIPIPSSFVDDYAAKLAELERDFFEDESPLRKKRCKGRDDHKHDKKHEGKQKMLSNCVNHGTNESLQSTNTRRDNTILAPSSHLTDCCDQSTSNSINHDQRTQQSEHRPSTAMQTKNMNATTACADTEQTSISPPEVTNIQLYQAVHDCFRDCDPNAAGTKSITKAVSRKLGIKLDKNQKIRVTEHLRNLIRENQPNPVELEKSVDQEFQNLKERNNVENIMKKEFIHTLQKIFHVPFGPQTMELVKQRVAHLLVLEQQSIHASIQEESDEQALLSENMSQIEQNGIDKNSGQNSPSRVLRKSVPNAGDENSAVKRSDNSESIVATELKTIPDVSVSDQKPNRCLPSERENDSETPTSDGAQQTTIAIQEIEWNDNMGQQENDITSAELCPAERPALENRASPKRKRGQRKKPTKGHDNVIGGEESIANKYLGETSSPGMKNTLAQGRKRSRACTLCSKCPCKVASRVSIFSMDLSHSDVAIEKSLIKRLMKLEAMTDKYDEQTEAVRRQLHKHRRDMYRKRMELLKKSNERRALPREKRHHFLPDVEELDEQFVREVHKKRPRNQVSKAQEMMFAKKSTNQATLTQKMGATNNNEAEEQAMRPRLHAIDAAEVTIDDRCENISGNFAIGAAEVTTDDRDESTGGDIGKLGKVANIFMAIDSPVPAVRIETDAQSDSRRHNSIWEAMKNGNFESPWDDLFREDSSETGVDYLVELLGDDSESNLALEEEKQLPWSQSCLSQNGKSIADQLTDQVSSDPSILKAVEKCCPHWKENIIFAMGQKEPADVNDALANVHKTREKLARARSNMLQHLENYDKTLGLFENILRQSLSRFTSPRKGSDDVPHSTRMETEYSSQQSKLVEYSCSATLAQQVSTLQNNYESLVTNRELNPWDNQINCKLLSQYIAKTDTRKLLGPESPFSVASRDHCVASK